MKFNIANICFALPDSFLEPSLAHALHPFAVDEGAKTDFEMVFAEEVSPEGRYHELERFDFTEDEADCRFGIDDAGNYILHMIPHDERAHMTNFKISNDATRVECDHTSKHLEASLRFGLWIAFNATAVRSKAVAIHSSVIVYRGQAVLMLGESGTGKSTQTRLWREHIEGAKLLNDDSPIVRGNEDRVADCYGSAWSGKAPCYINAHVPIRAFVRLSQAPYNKLRKLSRLEAIGALLPSCPLAFSHDKQLFNAVCATVSAIIKHTEVYHLECLPNEEAARLVRDTLFGAEEQ